jgi:uncharacterized protein YgiM (DUF1202 family)
MRNRLLFLFIPVLLFSCMQKPKPVAQASTETPVAIQYVAVPTLKIHTAPNEASDVITKYGFGETVSVLSHRGNWAELRMFDNSSGWVLTNELMSADDAKKLVNDTPRFYIEPQKVPGGRAHGEIDMQAKVNTDGTVISVVMTKNTTGSKALADQNVAALGQAQFFPIAQKGQRMTFFYTHNVYY